MRGLLIADAAECSFFSVGGCLFPTSYVKVGVILLVDGKIILNKRVNIINKIKIVKICF